MRRRDEGAQARHACTRTHARTHTHERTHARTHARTGGIGKHDPAMKTIYAASYRKPVNASPAPGPRKHTRARTYTHTHTPRGRADKTHTHTHTHTHHPHPCHTQAHTRACTRTRTHRCSRCWRSRRSSIGATQTGSKKSTSPPPMYSLPLLRLFVPRPPMIRTCSHPIITTIRTPGSDWSFRFTCAHRLAVSHRATAPGDPSRLPR